MIEVANFIIQSIIEFINSLRLIIIPNVGISLLTFYIGIMSISLIMTFIKNFFRIENNIFRKNINKQYMSKRQSFIRQASARKENKKHTTKYLQKNSRRYN